MVGLNSQHTASAVPARNKPAVPVTLPGITLRNGFRFREGQEMFLRKLADAFRQGRDNHLGVFVPGYGKTITALSSFAIAHALGVAKKLVVFVPRGNLRDQYADPKELTRVFGSIGAPAFSFCIADSERVFLKNLHTQIIITTYQYASGRGGHKALWSFCESAPSMFVFDEVHHLSDDGLWASRIAQFPFACSVALSGTPMRSDNKTLFGVPFEVRNNNGVKEQYYVALHEVSLRDAHQEGKILKRVAVHVIDYKIKMTRTDTGEMVELSLAQMADMTKSKSDVDAFLARKKLRFHDVYLQSLLQPAFERFAEKRRALQQERLANGSYGTQMRNHQMLVIAMSNKHASAILEYIQQYFPGVSAARIGQDVPEQERLKLLDDYRNGMIDVMVQVDMIGEGTDIKPISVIVKADLVRAFSKTMQQIFRGMRYYDGFSEEANVCDIYAANDSGVVHILEWISNEEQFGIKLKKERLLDEIIERATPVQQESMWELTDVQHGGTETHSLELFPDPSRTVQPKAVPAMEKVMDVAAREQELRQECANLASKLMFSMRSIGRPIEVSTIHAEAKRRFAKAQEHMSIPELTKKRDWLSQCIAARKLV